MLTQHICKWHQAPFPNCWVGPGDEAIAHVCVCVYVCLDTPLIVNFKWAHSQWLTWQVLQAWPTSARVGQACETKCQHQRVLQLSLENECEGLLPDCSVSMKESEDDLNWMHWQHTRQLTFWLVLQATPFAKGMACERDYFLIGTLRVIHCDRHQNVQWPSLLQVSTWYDRSYTAGIPCWLMVWLWSQCPCSHGSPPGQIAALWTCEVHFKYNFLLTQVHPRMM